jgi:predicted transcriptional regulator
MTKFITENIELDEETQAKLEGLAEENNSTIDQVVQDILEEYISKKMTVSEYVEWVKAFSTGDADTSPFEELIYILNEKGEMISKVVPVL